MYTNSCGRSCSSDPNVFFEFFKRPQNSSVTSEFVTDPARLAKLSIPDNVGVLGEMEIEVCFWPHFWSAVSMSASRIFLVLGLMFGEIWLLRSRMRR